MHSGAASLRHADIEARVIHKSLAVARWLASWCLVACSGNIAPAGSGDFDSLNSTVDAIADHDALTWPEAQSLSAGIAETLVTGITAAENIMFSSAGRLYVSGDDGVFELVRSPATGEMVANRLLHVDGCKFGGMSERAGTLYAVCYDTTQSQLYAAAETSVPAFAHTFTLLDVQIGNGMATDGTSLYITATGQGRIARLQMGNADPLHVIAQQPFMEDTGGLLPNGIKIYAGMLYWDDFDTIRRTSLTAPTTLDVRFKAPTFFDDFVVTDDSVLIADYLFGSVRQYGLDGLPMGSTPPGTFTNPSAVVQARARLGFGVRDLIVTDKGANAVVVFHF